MVLGQTFDRAPGVQVSRIWAGSGAGRGSRTGSRLGLGLWWTGLDLGLGCWAGLSELFSFYFN